MDINLETSNQTILVIGRSGENIVTKINFDFDSYFQEFGSGTPYLWYKRPSDSYEYPIQLDIENHIATWNITASDTQYVGTGQVQLIYVVNGVIKKKSRIFTVKVMESIDPQEETPPDPYKTWVDKIMQASETAQTSAETATTKANEANASAETASTKASEASTSAQTAVSAKNDAVSAKDTAVTSATTATTKASEASSSASSASTSARTATTKASEASTSATNAKTSEDNAKVSEENAERYATDLQSAIYTFTDPNSDGNIVIVQGGI